MAEDFVWEEREIVDLAGPTPPLSPRGVDSPPSTSESECDAGGITEALAPVVAALKSAAPAAPPAVGRTADTPGEGGEGGGMVLGDQNRARHRTMSREEAQGRGEAAPPVESLPPPPPGLGLRMKDEEKALIATEVGRLAKKADEDSDPRDSCPIFPQGCRVVAHSLARAAHLNGKQGIVNGKRQGERYGVTFKPPHGEKALLAANLRMLGCAADPPGSWDHAPRPTTFGTTALPDAATTPLRPDTFRTCMGSLGAILGQYGGAGVEPP
eukprot:Hpha_TRINITY_DN11769_c0_g3::TRINITY_DN11769_c0_g3_i1::g.31601::m.31601